MLDTMCKKLTKKLIDLWLLIGLKHIDIRNLWLQKEVREGMVELQKIPGDENPADLMTKFLAFKDVVIRLNGLQMNAIWFIVVVHLKGG